MATGDRLQIADKPTLDNVNTSIGETDDTGGSTVAGTVMAKLNKNLSQNESNSADLEFIKQLLGSGSQEWQEPGTYSFQVPAGITKLTITACGGGGGGSNGSNIGDVGDGDYVGGGGGGGAAIVDEEYIVNAGETIQITVGAGGSQNNNGASTVIGSLVTLPGGKAGSATHTKNEHAPGGTAGGAGGGAGGYGIMSDSSSITSQSGANGIVGKGGTGQTSNTGYGRSCGGGGGGSLGNGGNGCKSDPGGLIRATSGSRGGGGGGAYGHRNSNSSDYFSTAGAGGNGYVRIEWGL